MHAFDGPAWAALRPRGPAAGEIAELWWFLAILGGAVCVVVLALLAAALRRDGPARSAPGRWIVGGGVVMPTIVLTAVFAVSLGAMRAAPAAEGDEPVVEVIGHQWWWEVRYPSEGVVTANEIRVPVGLPVELRLRSADVIHSLWVPELAGKMDLMPDGETRLIIQADEPGEYAGRCAEFCGLQHARMGIEVVAASATDHQGWLDAQRRPAEPPDEPETRAGLDVFLTADCGSCHTVRGTPAAGTTGPDLTHLATRRMLAASTLVNDRESLTAWVTDPHTVKEGVEMPSPALDPEEVEAVVSFLEDLE